jgi:hypothetical protein
MNHNVDTSEAVVNRLRDRLASSGGRDIGCNE